MEPVLRVPEFTYGYDLLLVLYAVDKIYSCYELRQDARSRVLLQEPIVRALVVKLLMFYCPTFRDRVHGSPSLGPYPESHESSPRSPAVFR